MISIVWCLLIGTGACRAQSGVNDLVRQQLLEDSLLAEGPSGSVVQRIVRWMLPEWVEGSLDMKEFIRGAAFESYRREFGDRSAVDLIFRKSLREADGDIDDALVICLFGAMDHYEFGIRIPLFGFVVTIPLTTESKEEFRIRLSHLPSRLTTDTPPEGDKDKLQHFFGSALLAYGTGSRSWAVAVGNIMETTEQKYVVGGMDDPRDRRANAQGVEFGKLLLAGKQLLPSECMTGRVSYPNRNN